MRAPHRPTATAELRGPRDEPPVPPRSPSAASLSSPSRPSARAAARAGSPSPPPGRSAIAVRTAPVTVRDVVYRIQALGSLEPDELTQITAQVEGAVSEVLFREGDRVTPETVLLRIDPERYRLETERAEAALHQAVADAERAGADLKRREDLAESRLVAPEELAPLAPGDGAPAGGGRGGRGWPGPSPSRTCGAPRCARPPPASSTRAPWTPASSSRPATCSPPSSTPPACACASGCRTPSRCPPARGRRSPSGCPPSALGTSRPASTTWARSPTRCPARSRCSPGSGTRGSSSPASSPRSACPDNRRARRWWCPRGPILASEQGFIAYVVDGGTVHERPIQLGLRTGDGLVEILDGLTRDETVVVEGSDRLADGAAVRDAGPARGRPGAIGRSMSDQTPPVRARRARGGPPGDRDGHDPRGHLHPQPRLRLGADVRAHRLRDPHLHRLGHGVPGPRHQPEPRRGLPGGQRLGDLGGRLARGHGDRRRRLHRGRDHHRRGRQADHLHLAPGLGEHHRRVRAEPQHRRRAPGRADQGGPGGAAPAPGDRPADHHQEQPRGQPDHVAGAVREPPGDLPRRLRPQRPAAPVPDHPRRRRDHPRRLPRAHDPRLVRRGPDRGPGPDRPGRQQRHRARAPRDARRPHRDRGARDERAGRGRGARHRRLPRPASSPTATAPRSASRTWRWSRTASRTAAASPARSGSPPSASASASCAARTRSRSAAT